MQPAVSGKARRVLLLLGIYVLIGLLLAATWTGAAAIRHFGGLTAFLVVVVAWPLILVGLIVAARNS